MSSIVQKIINRALTATNNIVTNRLLVALKIDHLPRTLSGRNLWSNKAFDDTKTLQENVGFTHHPELQPYVDQTHRMVQDFAKHYLKPNASVLDLGCGTGLYLNDFPKTYKLAGIDVNDAFMKQAAILVPEAKFYLGSLLYTKAINEKFDLIFSISAIQYIEPSKCGLLFEKLATYLNEGGYIFIQYPHAVSSSDLWYPDLTYIKYSPNLIASKAAPYFDIVSHKHFFDDRQVDQYDTKVYYHPEGKGRTDTILNDYLLIARKKS